MASKLQFRVRETTEDDGAVLLPYPEDFRDGRTNRGFVDLRGNPDKARQIPDAIDSPALQDLLAQLAQPDAKFISIGCEAGAVPPPSPEGQYSAGCYVQIAFAHLHGPALDKRWQTKLADALRFHLGGAVGERRWLVEFTVAVVGAEAIGGPEQVWAPVIHLHAYGPTAASAEESREALIRAVAAYLNNPQF